MPHFSSLSAAGFRYFTVATPLLLPWGKLNRHRIFEHIITKDHGFVWGHLLDDDTALTVTAAKFVEEIPEWEEALTPMEQAGTIEEFQKIWAAAAGEAADIEETCDYTRKILPQAPAYAPYHQPLTTLQTWWADVCHGAQDAQTRADAERLACELLPATRSALHKALTRKDLEPVRLQLPLVRTEKENRKGRFNGWTMKAAAVPVGNRYADQLAASLGWKEEDPATADISKALDLPTIMSFRYPVETM